jgi:hypothetical protein
MLPLPPVTQALMLICTAAFCSTLRSALVLALWPLGMGASTWQVLTTPSCTAM